MALSGVRISWLILARKSDFADEALLRLALGVEQLLLGVLPVRDVAEDGAELVAAVADRAPIVMNSGIRPPSRPRPITSRPLRAFAAPDCWQPSRYSQHVALAFRREQAGERQAGHLAALIAEQLLGAAVDRVHVGVAVEHDHAVGRGIEDVADFAGFRLGVAQRHLEGLLPVVAAGAADAGQHQHQRGFALPRRGEQPRLHRHLVALIGGDGERLRAVVGAERRRRSARRTARRVRRPPPARATGRSRSSRGRRGWRRSACRADRPARRSAAGRGSDAGRRRASAGPPVLLVPVALGSLGAAAAVRGGSLRLRRFGGSGRAVIKLFRLVLGAAQPRGETVRQFTECVALDRRQRRHVFRRARRGERHDIHRRRHRGEHRALVAEHRRFDARSGGRCAARRVCVSSLMRATSRQTPKPR